MSATRIKAVDFFCGGGGMSLGMHKAGIEVIAGIDNDPECRETYEVNHPMSKFIQADITDYKIDELAQQVSICTDDDNMLFIGCAPCQFWSRINGYKDSERKQSAHGGRNLLRNFLHFVKHYRPGFVVIENVTGIERHSKESGLDELYDFFKKENYCYDKGALLANDYGVPQSRRRFILIASRVTDSICLPKPQTKKPTVFDVIGGKKKLPNIVAGECDSRDKLHRCSFLSITNMRRLKLTPPGGLREHWADRDDLMINAYRNKPKLFPRNYGRMAWDKPAPTITTNFCHISTGRFGHPEENRAISLREGAMLQTFPKEYKFKTTTLVSTARIIGNAVPPNLAKQIGKSIVQQWTTYLMKKNYQE